MNVFDRRERTPRKWRPPVVRPRIVTWWNLPLWLAKSLAVELRDRVPAGRPVTVRRLLASAPPRLHRPIFLVGAPRSGTSFLGGCIAAVDDVQYHREPVLMKALGQHASETSAVRWNERRLRATIRLLYAMLAVVNLSGDRRLCEKTPQNAFLVSVLARTFPDATFVHLVRDGRDATMSYLDKPWVRQVFAWTRRRDPGGQPYGSFAPYWVPAHRRAEFESTSDVHRAIWVWRAHVEAARAQLGELPRRRWVELRYEDVVADPAAAAATVAAATGLDADQLREAMVEATPGSIGRWRRELDDVALATVEREAGALLAELGYR